MRLLKSGSIFILFVAAMSMQGQTQQVINNVAIEKKNGNLYQVQYSISQNPDFDIEKAVLKIYRRRNNYVEEIFTLPVTIPATTSPNQQVFTFDWTATNGLVQAGDDLQAKIILSLKTSLARQKLNRIPFADAGGFMQVELPLTRPLELNGSKSHDKDGKIIDIEWKQVGGPNSLTISNKDSLIAYADGDFKTGTYAFELTIKDNLGSVSSSRTSITVKGQSYWTDRPATPKKGNAVPPQKNPSKLKGGPSNAALNLLVPGLGHYYVSGDYRGQNRKATAFIITGIYAGALGAGLYLNQKSGDEYDKYSQMAAYREYRNDAGGNVIGMRGASQAEAEAHYDKAQTLHKNALVCLGLGGAVLAGDFVYTLLKGNRNKKEWQTASTSFKPNLFFSSGGGLTTAGIQLKF